MIFEQLVELRRVTEFIDGAVYRTEVVGEVWVPQGTQLYKLNDRNEMYVSLSTKRLKELGSTTIRVKK